MSDEFLPAEFEVPPPTRGKKDKSLADARNVLKKAMARAMTAKRAKQIMNVLFQAAEGGSLVAIGMIQDRYLGKPSVGTAATAVDDSVDEALRDQLGNMSREDLKLAYKLSLQITGKSGGSDQAALMVQQALEERAPEVVVEARAEETS